MYPIYVKESTYLPYDEMYQAYMGTSVWESTYQGSDKNVPSGISNKIGIKQEVLDEEEAYEVLYQEAKNQIINLAQMKRKKLKSMLHRQEKV